MSTADLTAQAGQDYLPLHDFPITFNPGETAKSIRVTLTPDSVPEDLEEFSIQIRAASPGWISTYPSTATVRIREARILAGQWENNQFILTVQTSNRQSYAVEVSSDLISWSILAGAEHISGTGNPVPIVDSGPVETSHRFYRLRVLE